MTMLGKSGVDHPLIVDVDGEMFALYEFSYSFDGHEFGVYFYARSIEEAKERLAAMDNRTLTDGAIQGIYPVDNFESLN